MKAIGGILTVIGIIVGVYAYNMETTVSGLEEYFESYKNFEKETGKSDKAGLTNDELIQKKIADKNQTFIIAGVVFIAGIILISRKSSNQ